MVQESIFRALLDQSCGLQQELFVLEIPLVDRCRPRVSHDLSQVGDRQIPGENDHHGGVDTIVSMEFTEKVNPGRIMSFAIDAEVKDNEVVSGFLGEQAGLCGGGSRV